MHDFAFMLLVIVMSAGVVWLDMNGRKTAKALAETRQRETCLLDDIRRKDALIETYRRPVEIPHEMMTVRKIPRSPLLVSNVDVVHVRLLDVTNDKRYRCLGGGELADEKKPVVEILGRLWQEEEKVHSEGKNVE